MSLLPSALKSPVSTTVHGLGAEPGEPPPITVEPLSSHSTTCPLVPLRQRMSAKPSRLKSRCPTTAQGFGADPGEPPPITLTPLNSQFTTCPLTVLYQSTSLLQSLLKSWVSTSSVQSPGGTSRWRPNHV